MALGTTLRIAPMPGGQRVEVAYPQTKWVTAIDAGGVDGADNSGNRIVNAVSSITASDHHLIELDGLSEYLLVRLAYDDGVTGVTWPVIQVFGFDHNGVSAAPVLLKNNDAAPLDEVTIQGDPATDVTDGTLCYTSPSLTTHAFHTLGSRYVLIGIKTAMSGTGTYTNAYLQVK